MAKKKRKKTVVVSNVTREEAEEALAIYAKSTGEIDKIAAEIDLAAIKLREKYGEKLTALEKDRDEAFEKLQVYATENKDELFKKKKSLDMLHGMIGFRTGMPKLKTAKGFTWASVLILMKEKMQKYIRTTEEIAKDLLLADREAEGMADKMASVGIVVAQDETFFVEPKTESKD